MNGNWNYSVKSLNNNRFENFNLYFNNCMETCNLKSFGTFVEQLFSNCSIGFSCVYKSVYKNAVPIILH